MPARARRFDPNLIHPGSPDAPEAMPEETSMSFLASFVIAGELYGVDDNNTIWRWDVDQGAWLKAGTIDRDG